MLTMLIRESCIDNIFSFGILDTSYILSILPKTKFINVSYIHIVSVV